MNPVYQLQFSHRYAWPLMGCFLLIQTKAMSVWSGLVMCLRDVATVLYHIRMRTVMDYSELSTGRTIQCNAACCVRCFRQFPNLISGETQALRGGLERHSTPSANATIVGGGDPGRSAARKLPRRQLISNDERVIHKLTGTRRNGTLQKRRLPKIRRSSRRT